jgi:hypothetical protein
VRLLTTSTDPDLTIGSQVLCHETDADGSIYRLGTVQGFGTLGGEHTIRVTYPSRFGRGAERSEYRQVATDETILLTPEG